MTHGQMSQFVFPVPETWQTRPALKEHAINLAAEDPPPQKTRARPLIYIYDLPAIYNSRMLQYRPGKSPGVALQSFSIVLSKTCKPCLHPCFCSAEASLARLAPTLLALSMRLRANVNIHLHASTSLFQLTKVLFDLVR